MNSDKCMGCGLSWQADESLGLGTIWIQCDVCDGWIHKDCFTDSSRSCVDEDSTFTCPSCRILLLFVHDFMQL